MPRRAARLPATASCLGLAFQIADDLLDIEGKPAAMGKAARKDARKATLVAVMGTEAAKQRLAALEADAIAELAIVRRRG